MSEPGHRPQSNGQQLHNYPGQYQGSGHPPEPRRSSIQSMLNPSSPDLAGSYAYYPGSHGAHPPPHHLQQQPYLQSIKQPPPPVSQQQHHHQQPPSHHTDQYRHDDRQYPPQSYHYSPQPHAHPPVPQHQHPIQQPPPQQSIHHHHHVTQQSHPSHHHQPQPSQQQGYYPPHSSSSSSLTSLPSAVGSVANVPYSGNASSLPSMSSQSQFRPYSQYSPGSNSSESFQGPPPSSTSGPPQAPLHSHHQPSPQQRHHQHGSISGPISGSSSHSGHVSHSGHAAPVLISGGNGLGSMSHAPPRRSSGEAVMDIRLQSPPANSAHYGHVSAGHLAARAPSPPPARISAAEFTRSRQASVAGHTYHEFRHIPAPGHGPESPGPGAHHEYSQRYGSPYQESSFSTPHHASTPQRQQHQSQHQQHPPHTQHQPYTSQYPQHPNVSYMRSSLSETDRPHSHTAIVPQHYHQGYVPQPSPPLPHAQPPIVSPTHRGSMQDIHTGGPRPAVSNQHVHQQPPHHSHERPHERPLTENDEAIVMNFMSELQMQQQQQQQCHAPNQNRNPMPPPPLSSQAPPQSAQQPHHIQQQQQQRHHHHQQQQQLPSPPIPQQHQPQQHHHHVDHLALHAPEHEQQHAQYGEHLAYQRSQDVQSPIYHPPSSETNRAMTPPGHGHTTTHIAPVPTADARQRPMSLSTGSESPISGPSLSASSFHPAKPDAPKKLPTSGSHPSLAPRSLSLMKILNAPEGSGDPTELEEAEDRGVVVSGPDEMMRERNYNGQYQYHSYQQDLGQQTETPSAHPDAVRTTHHEEQQSRAIDSSSSMEYQAEPENPPIQDDGLNKAGKEKGTRAVKEKVQKEKLAKAPKEKVVKEKVEKPKKERIVKMPPKKKATVSSIVATVSDTLDAVAEPTIKIAAQDMSGSLKHSIEAKEMERAGHPLKKIRVELIPALEKEQNEGATPFATPSAASAPAAPAAPSSPSGSTEESNAVVNPIATKRSELPRANDEVRVNGNIIALPGAGSSHVQDTPRQRHDPVPKINSTTEITGPKTALEVKASSPSGSKGTPSPVRSRSSTPAPAPAPAPILGTLASRYRPTVESDLKESGDRSKKISNDDLQPAASSQTSVSRETSKAVKTSSGVTLPLAKEKKVSKKKSIVDSAPLELAPTALKAVKGHLALHKEMEDMEMEDVEAKTPTKATPSATKKLAPTLSSQTTSMKKRLSKSAEDLSLMENLKSSEPVKASVSTVPSSAVAENTQLEPIQDKVMPSESAAAREKTAKQKRVDRIEPSFSPGTKNEVAKPEIYPKAHISTSKSKESVMSTNGRVVRENPVPRESVKQTQTAEDEGLYCICRTPYDPSRFMIACDGCDDWFHGDCVGVAEKDSDMVDKYYCKRCEDKGRHDSRKKKCFREACQKPAVHKSKYCSKECGLLVATQRIKESQARVFGSEELSTDGQIQRRRRLTLADLDDRQRLLSVRERVKQVREVCSILNGREQQLKICIDRQTRQDFGKFALTLGTMSNDKEDGKATAMADDDEAIESSSISRAGSLKSKGKGKGQKAKDRDKDKEAFCGFDYSLVWDDVQDISHLERASATTVSLATTPAGSRASSLAPPSFGVVLVNLTKKLGSEHSDGQDGKSHNANMEAAVVSSAEENTLDASESDTLTGAQLEEIGKHVCMSRRQCDRHNGWQKLKAAELELEKMLQNKLLKTLKAEAKQVKNRMKRRRNDLSAGILNGTIEH